MMPTPSVSLAACRRLAACAALLLAGVGTSYAQGLSEMYTAARSYDATYQAARAAAEAAEYRAAQAEGLALPNLTANVRGAAVVSRLPRAINGDNDVLQAGMNGRYPLYNQANKATIDQAHRSLEASRADLETAEQDLIIRVSQAYFDVLAAEDTAQLTRVSKAAILEQLASAKRNFEVGTATITDAREAQARADLASAQEIAADTELRNRRIVLGTLVGRRNLQPLPLNAPVVLPPLLPDDVERWVDIAESVHPQVLRARSTYEVAQLEIDKARAAGMPTVDAVAGVSTSRYTGYTTLPGNSYSGTVGIELNWPLYTGGIVQNRVKETVSLATQAHDNLDNVQRTVAQNTRLAFFTVRSGQALVGALEAAEASSKLSLEATELGYKVGVRVNIDVLNAQTQLFQTQRDLFKARYDVLIGRLRLQQASGQLSPVDLDAVSRLLAR